MFVLFLLVFVMPASLYSLLRSPRVQQYICGLATDYLSKELGTTVTVGSINIAFFLDLVLEDVVVLDKHQNTLLYAPYIRADIDDIDLEKKQISLAKASLDGTFFALMKYKNEKKLNLQFLLDYLKSADTTAPKNPAWGISIKSLVLSDTRFVYNDQNARHPSRGMDYAYLDISDINLDMDQMNISGDTVTAHIHFLSAREKNGFILDAFTAQVMVNSHMLDAQQLHIKTPHSDLDLDLKFSYDQWDDYNHFIQNVYMDGTVRKSKLNLSDIGCFAPQLENLDIPLELMATVAGRVDSLAGKELYLRYGANTLFRGDALIVGLPYFKESYFRADIHSFTSHYTDIATLQLPDGHGGMMHPNIPEELKALGHIRLEGNCYGQYLDFIANLDLQSDLGHVNTAIHMTGEKGKGLQFYDGQIITTDFNVGRLLQIEDIVGTLSMDATVKGSGFTKETAALLLKGNVHSFVFKQYQYQSITVDAELTQKIFNGSLKARDPNLNLDFTGYVDFRDSIPVYDFFSTVRLARLNKLNLIKSDSITDISCDIRSHFQGTDIDNIFGTISIENASYKDGQQYFTLNSFKLTALTGLLNYRTFFIKSDYVDATFKGYFFFRDITASVKKYISSHLPGVSFAKDTLLKPLPRQDFDFDIVFYNATPVLKYFVKDITVSPNTTLKGDFDSDDNTLNFDFNSDEFTWQKTRFLNISSHAVTNNEHIDFTTRCARVLFTDSARVEQLQLLTDINNDSISFILRWDNNKDTNNNSADIKGYLTFTEGKNTLIGIRSSNFTLSDTVWNIYSGGDIKIDSMGINIPGIYLISHHQQLEIKGRASRNPNDKVRVRFINFNLSDFDYVTNRMDFDLDGKIDGHVDVSDVFNTPSFSSDLRIKKLGFNGSTMGDATISSTWDDVSRGIKVNMEVLYVGVSETSKPVLVEGYLYPSSKKDNLDLTIDVTNFQLVTLSRYLDQVATIKSGTASGKFTLKGPFTDPDLKGNVQIMRTGFSIAYLNTTYGCAHREIRFDKNSISFDNLVLLDQPYGDSAICNGRITHRRFKDWNFDLHIYPKRFLCLNTVASQNDLFYGTGFASGYAHIYGDQKNVKIDMDVKTERNTQLFIPMDYTSEVSENSFINFINKDGIYFSSVKGQSYTGVELSMNFKVTDDAEVQILFDPAVGDRIRGRCNGNLSMEYTADGKFTMNGDMIVKSGDYLFTFENVINKRFNIEEGGSIRWTGDPYDADLNLRAIYRLKASLSTFGEEGSIAVNCIINMSGQLVNPTFTFDIDMPTISQDRKALYMSIIQANMNYNFLTLLMVNSFYSPGVAIGGNNSQAAGSIGLLGKTSSEVLSNQMSNWLSQISKKVDIGINYRPGDQITQQEVELALSTQLFDDRVRIESNVGVGGGLANSQTKNSTNIVGDVNVEVKLTEDTRLRVFNKSNQQDYFIHESPYTQGVGVFYRKEFDSFKDLFKRKKKKQKVKKTPVSPSDTL